MHTDLHTCTTRHQRWPWIRSRLRQHLAFFFRIRIRSNKFVKTRTRIRSHFSISAAAGVCLIIHKVNALVNLGWIDCSQSLNKSRIFKFENFRIRIEIFWNRSGVGVCKSDPRRPLQDISTYKHRQSQTYIDQHII